RPRANPPGTPDSRPPKSPRPTRNQDSQHHQALPPREHQALPTHVQTAWPLTPVRVTNPDGRILGGGSQTSPEFELVRPAAFFARLDRDAKVGFGEAYMAGDWRAGSGTDLADLLTPFAARLTTLVPAPLQKLRALVDKRVPHDHENTPDGSRSNIAAHYDLSNDLFAAFLDQTMTYSSAWFDESEPGRTATRLEEAQLRKIDGILDLAGVRSVTRLLEIGTGWGTLAIRAAQRGARVT